MIRAKAGGRQSTKDGAGGKKIKSAGSSLRRHNEAALERDVRAPPSSVFKLDCVFQLAAGGLGGDPTVASSLLRDAGTIPSG